MPPTVKMFVRTAQTHFPLLLDLKFAVMRRVRRWRKVPFDRDFSAISLFRLNGRALFLDVGANRGQSTDAILMLAPGAVVHQFEPNPLLCEKLVRAFKADERVVTHAFGLAAHSSEHILYVPFYRRWMFDGLASFDEASARDWLRDRLLFFRDRHLTVQRVNCSLRTMDELALAPSFIKVDVQGYEFEVLRGGLETLRRHQPILLIEAPPEDRIVALLENLGYAPFSFSEGRFWSGTTGGNNIYFLPERVVDAVRAHTAA